MRTSRLVLRSASSSTRRLTTMLRRRLLSLMILNSKLCPSSSSMLGTRRSAIWLPGRKASTPIRSTTTPPLIFLTRVPDTASSFSWASRIRSHTRMKSAFFFERTTAPSWSSRCSRKTSISSPSFRLRGSLNSSIGTAPSDLNPTSRMTAVSVTRSTFDLTISPSSMFERVPSYSSVIFAISSGEYSSWRSARTRRGEWRLGVAGLSALESGSSWVSTSIQLYRFGCGFGVVTPGHRPGVSRPCALRCPQERLTPGRWPGAAGNLAGEPVPRQRHHAGNLVVERQACRVEHDRIRGCPERGHRPRGISLVSGRQRFRFPAQLLRVDPTSPPSLRQAAPGALFRARRQEHLQRGVGEHHSPDVPAVHDDARAVPQRRVALLHVHPVPHLGDRRDLRHPARHPLGANRLLHIHAGDLGPKPAADEHQSHWQVFGERDDPLRGP